MSAEFKGSDDFPVLLLRRQVAFPRVVVRVLVGRKRSLALLKHLQKQVSDTIRVRYLFQNMYM